MRADERVQLMQEQMARVAAEAARAAAEDGERRAAFLSNASQLLASSLEFEDTLKRVAKLTTPELCDWCTVNIVREDGELQCLAIAHVHGNADSAGNPGGFAPSDPVFRVMKTGTSLLVHNAAEDETEAVRAIENRFAKIGMTKVTSYMIVPLRAHERMLGALKFIMSESGRQLTRRDLALAEDLGRRAAIAIDNARLYKEARLANRMKDDFLTVLSHELRTPLTPILGWTRMLREEKLGPPEQKRALEVIERNAQNQAKLVEDLLDVSRIITGKLRLNMQPVDLSALIATSIDSLRPAADGKNIQVVSDAPAESMVLPGDGERLQQVLWNLLSNAIKFTPNDGAVCVRAYHKTGKMFVEVSDNGRGIDPKFLPFVFDRFRQADSSTTRVFGGLGIGLAIVRHLVELHGGTVQAQSPGIGQGSTFTVTLPVLERRASDHVEKIEPGPDVVREETGSDRITGLRILIVDDEPDTSDLLVQVFKRRGAAVSSASSVREALERLSDGMMDVLISDIGMPGEDGYGLIKKVRGNVGGHAAIPAIALTAYAREEDGAAARAAGFQIHLAKPVDPDTLVAAVEGLVLPTAPAAPA